MIRPRKLYGINILSVLKTRVASSKPLNNFSGECAAFGWCSSCFVDEGSQWKLKDVRYPEDMDFWRREPPEFQFWPQNRVNNFRVNYGR